MTHLAATARGLDPDLDDGRRRFFDRSLGMTIVQVLQGDYYVTNRKDEVLTTVLGSCIAACVRDPWWGVGGMNHFLLPAEGGSVDVAVSTRLRYGAYAMEQLINDVLSRGGRRDRLEIKLFGGGNVVAGLGGVGHRNADFIERYMGTEGFRIAASHLRGTLPRKVQYTPRTGRVRMRELDPDKGRLIFERERRKQPECVVSADAGSIELFD